MAEENKIGALWAKKSAKGDYFTGQIELNGEKIPVVVFFNSNKTKETQPDWSILRAQPREQKENPQPTPEDITPSDIPF